MSLSNYPPGMSSGDWDHVYGIVRCGECDKPTDEDSRCDDCGECRNCANSEMVYNEDRDEYLCEKCADRKNSK